MEKISGFLLEPVGINRDTMKSMTGTYGGTASGHYGRLKATQAILTILKERGIVRLTPKALNLLNEKVKALKSHHGEGGVNQSFFEGFWIQIFFILSQFFDLGHKEIEELMRELYPFEPEKPIAGS